MRCLSFSVGAMTDCRINSMLSCQVVVVVVVAEAVALSLCCIVALLSDSYAVAIFNNLFLFEFVHHLRVLMVMHSRDNFQ